MTLDEKLKILYKVTDLEVLNIYKDMACDSVKSYLNIEDTNENIYKKYESALIEIIGNKIKSENNNGVKSYTASKMSITYEESSAFIITDKIKTLLPVPFVKLMG
ncbi:hypothetical protein SAMN02745163_03748 [Clostridium cavendishii DSM 21758]|uniref:Phage gp6-like head-tail connector protein n=1 Tax=Clostridium cavendishii DSM 21758 TaxID=1121302 RepID=A0A1M6S3U0_9CLOT|nr:phage head-tail connector protein [Clostridium cavendishii]SHK39504.1 hypothetical protein SAMN02745163_03748 [Clostridium cavendishii DSM 21758]